MPLMRWPSVLSALLTLVRWSRASDPDQFQLASMSPCAIPTPQLVNFSLVCTRYPQLHYACDRDGIVSRDGALELNEAVNDLQIFDSNIYALAVMLQRRIALPTDKDAFDRQVVTTDDVEKRCRHWARVFASDESTGTWTPDEVRLYTDLYAETIRSRWFHYAPCQRNFLLLIASEGAEVGGAPVINSPVLAVVYGENMANMIPPAERQEILRKASLCLTGPNSVVTTLRGVIKSVADRLKALEVRPQHSIPQWAVITVGCSFGGVILLLFANWFFISRNALKARKSQGAPDGGRADWKAGGFLAGMINSKRKSENPT